MKTFRLLFLLVLIASLFGCKAKKEAEELRATNQQMTNQLQRCDSLLNEYRNLINEVEGNLNQTLPEGQAPQQTQDLQQLRNRINNTITEIRSTLEESEQRAQALRNRGYRFNRRANDLEAEVDTLNMMVQERDSIINNCNEQVTELNTNIEDLNSQLSDMSNVSTRTKQSLDSMIMVYHKAYYISGTEDELMDEGIIQKEGGFLGFLGQVKVLNPRLDKSMFREIDFRDMTTFGVRSEVDDVNVITNHPEGSYEVNEITADSAVVNVTDPAEFWRISKYLVVVGKD